METGDSSHRAKAGSQVSARLHWSKRGRDGVVAWEMTTESLGKLVAYFLSSSHCRGLTTHSPCSWQCPSAMAHGAMPAEGLLSLVPRPSSLVPRPVPIWHGPCRMDQRADAMRKSIDWAIRHVRLAGSIWPWLPARLTRPWAVARDMRDMRDVPFLPVRDSLRRIPLGTEMEEGPGSNVRNARNAGASRLAC
jgi:hypothetical protein